MQSWAATNVKHRIPRKRGRPNCAFCAYWDWEMKSRIDVSGPVPDNLSPDIIFTMNKVGDLIEAESGDPAAFTF